jgi:hypothetical protein
MQQLLLQHQPAAAVPQLMSLSNCSALIAPRHTVQHFNLV